MTEHIRYYPDIWWKLSYEFDDSTMHFSGFKIEVLDESPELSTINEDAEVWGTIKFDGACEMNYCGYMGDVVYAEQFYELVKEIYRICEEHFMGIGFEE